MKFEINFRALFNRIWFGRVDQKVHDQSRFIDLAPTAKADKDGVYSEALFYATKNPRVSNIALTGPYGSGKSSIIESFLIRYNRPALQISLAAFLPEATSETGKVSKQEIERSILQQMLYGADANKLPLSRFKRIKTPGKSAVVVSAFLLVGILSCWNIARNIDGIVDGSYFIPLALGNWFNIFTFLLGIIFIWVVLHYLYISSFGVSLKSISLKDIEIAPVAPTQDSILNRHLDEIIYFFQSTRYDLVVIEDLDRFNNSEIFVTLREINSLVNANAGVIRPVRFLYALRDDMFVNIDRTKFFEFIIPVIPIINSSNSIDKVLEQGQRLALDDRLNRQFLREVSRYLNDLRLIQNIFNEYAIYVANLETGDEKVLDPNKLLAVLIYKNVFPRDFENLHRGKGALAKILERHDEFIARGESELKAEISNLEGQVDRAQRQVPSDLQELRRIYAMALIEKLPAMVTHVGVDGQALAEISGLSKHELFDQIIEAERVTWRNVHNNQQQLPISGLQSEVDSNRTYQQRKAEIEGKSVEFINAVSKSVRDLRAKISTLRTAKFNEIARLNVKSLDEQFQELGDDGRLAKFLVLEGFIDDTYYQYISLFHSGRLSPSDNKFLIQIRGFSNPEADFQVDNPKEVIAAMREDDFRQVYVLNVKIVDCLLTDPFTYAAQTTRMLKFVAADFEQCEPFLTTYYDIGAEVTVLLTKLVEMSADFVPNVIVASRNLSHVTHLVAHLPLQLLEALPAKYPELSRYVSSNLAPILGLGVDVDPTRLTLLGIEVPDLAAIGSFPGTARFLLEEGLYSLNIDNLEFVFRDILGIDDADSLQTRHYTTVLKSGNAALVSRIERNFLDYFESVVLKLDSNSQESVTTILAAIAHEEIELDDLSAFLEKQAALLPSLEGVPTRLHPVVFELAKIEATWANCIAFIASAEFDAESLTAYLNTNITLAALSSHSVPDGDNAQLLRKFLIENDALQDDSYRTYVKLLPRQFGKFPETLGANKLRILVEEKRIRFSAENLGVLDQGGDLQVLFVATNIELYLADQGAHSVDDDFRENLLGSEISDDQKLSIVRSMDLTMLPTMPSRARAVGKVLERTGAYETTLDAAAARAIVLNASPTDSQIALFNLYQKTFEREAVREILAALPKPFSDISAGYHTPVLELNARNIELANWLDARSVISSWSKGFFGETIRVNLFRR